MQLAQGHHLNADFALVLPAFGCCIALFYTCAQDGLDTVQRALVVFSFHLLAKIFHLHSWSSPTATYAGDVFTLSTSTFTNVRTNE